MLQTYILGELLSPVFTPIVLYCCLRPKALDIVDFFRNFTVEVVGVGDVCSFAQMDVRRHGNPTWQNNVAPVPVNAPTNQYNQVTSRFVFLLTNFIVSTTHLWLIEFTTGTSRVRSFFSNLSRLNKVWINRVQITEVLKLWKFMYRGKSAQCWLIAHKLRTFTTKRI